MGEIQHFDKQGIKQIIQIKNNEKEEYYNNVSAKHHCNKCI